MVDGKDVGQTVLDLYTTHNLADTFRPGEDRTRIKYGAVAAGTFFLFAPWVKEKFGDLDDFSADDLTIQDAAIVGVVATAGAAALYYLKPDEQPIMRIPEDQGELKKPHPLLVGLSAVYLAASLLDPTQSAEFKTRQRAGVIGGLAAYTFGPEATEKVITYLAPDNENYRTRRAITGGLVAGTGGALIRYVTK